MIPTASVGVLSELRVMGEYARRGYTVSAPVGVARYDFVAERDGRFVRVQVKTGTSFNGGRELIAHTDKPLTRKDADLLGIYNPVDDSYFYVPVEHVAGQRNIRVRLEPYVYGVKKKLALDGSMYRTFIG